MSKGLDEARRLGLWSGRGEFDMAKAFDTRLYAFVGGAHRRRALNTHALACGLTPGWAAMANRLRDHGLHGEDFSAHDNRQVCLHAGSLLRPSQTTASLIARLAPYGEPRIAATGTSAPCMGLFEPLAVGPGKEGSLVVEAGSTVASSPWNRFEPVHQRALFDTPFRQSLHASRDAETPCRGTHSRNAVAVQAGVARAMGTNAVAPWRGPGRLGAWWRKRAMRELAQGQDRFP